MSQKIVKNRFHLVREGRTQILADPQFLKWLHKLGFEKVGEIFEKTQLDPSRGGRQGLRVFCPDGRHDHRFVVRHYAHGGLLRRLLGDRFFLGSRPFREMMITEEIRKRGIPTVHVVAALCHRGWGPFYRGELITEEIPGARDVVSLLFDFGKAPSKREHLLRRETVRHAGRAVRLMHDRGVYHGDLNLKNILVQTANRHDPGVFIIDFDRSKIRKSLSTRHRMRNLLRLNRSVEKWNTKGAGISYTDKARFFQAYADGDSEIVHTMRRHLKGARIRARWYRIGWLADRLLNPADH